MNKKNLLIVSVVAAGLILMAYSASASKYSRKPYTPPEETAGAESVTSMSDCMSFSASFASNGLDADKSMFNKQFGAPISATGRTSTYNYDNYTKIMLECPSGKCNCRCISK